MPFLLPNQQCQSNEGITSYQLNVWYVPHRGIPALNWHWRMVQELAPTPPGWPSIAVLLPSSLCWCKIQNGSTFWYRFCQDAAATFVNKNNGLMTESSKYHDCIVQVIYCTGDWWWLHCTLASCSIVYCNRSCLWVCDGGRAGGVRTLLQPARTQCLCLWALFFIWFALLLFSATLSTSRLYHAIGVSKTYCALQGQATRQTQHKQWNNTLNQENDKHCSAWNWK